MLMEALGALFAHILVGLNIYGMILTGIFILANCYKKKKKADAAAPVPGPVVSSFPFAFGAMLDTPGAFPVGQEARPPIVGGIMGAYDPNYQTLAGVGGDVFENKGNVAYGGPKAPTTGGIVDTHDPNYQTLAGVANVFEDKEEKGKDGGDAKVPEKKGEAEIHDPNYQTLAGVAGDVFEKKDEKKKEVKKPEKVGEAGIHDPNYQTLAGVVGDVFGKKK